MSPGSATDYPEKPRTSPGRAPDYPDEAWTSQMSPGRAPDYQDEPRTTRMSPGRATYPPDQPGKSQGPGPDRGSQGGWKGCSPDEPRTAKKYEHVHIFQNLPGRAPDRVPDHPGLPGRATDYPDGPRTSQGRALDESRRPRIIIRGSSGTRSG